MIGGVEKSYGNAEVVSLNTCTHYE